MEHPIQGLMRTAMESIKGMVDVNTVVGDAVHTQDGTLVIPVSSVSFGFAAGGSEFGRSDGRRSGDDGAAMPFGGGSGAGVSVRPVGFLVVQHDGRVRLLPVDEHSTLEHMVDLAPDVVDRVREMFAGGERRNGHRGRNGHGGGQSAAEGEQPASDFSLPGER